MPTSTARSSGPSRLRPRFTQCQQRVLACRRQSRSLAGQTAPPLLAGKAQAQRIVLHQQSLQGRLDGRRLQEPRGRSSTDWFQWCAWSVTSPKNHCCTGSSGMPPCTAPWSIRRRAALARHTGQALHGLVLEQLLGVK